MYDRILVPTDGSDHARLAAAHASHVAAALDATLHLLAVVDVAAAAGPFSAGGVSDEYRERIEGQAETWLDETADAVDDAVPRERAVGDGVPAEAIVAHAEEVGADLIAMGTHGRTGVGRFVLGSVTERVLHLAAVPVYTVTARDGRDPGAPIEEVLVPTDGSERAAMAVDHGLAFAGIDGARVHAVSVLDESVSPEEADPLLDEIHDEIEVQASEAVAAIADAATDAGLETTTALREGHPAEALLAYVEEADIDLIAMGTQGRTGLSRYLLGSTTERVVRHAPVPVVAVPASAEGDDAAADGE